MTPPRRAPLMLFDGDCGFCNLGVRTLLRLDPRGALAFAPIQGDTAARYLARHPAPLAPDGSFDSVVVVDDPDGPRERGLTHSAAVLQLLRYLGGAWGLVAVLARAVPEQLRDALYLLVARNRLRFPGADHCAVLPPDQRRRILP